MNNNSGEDLKETKHFLLNTIHFPPEAIHVLQNLLAAVVEFNKSRDQLKMHEVSSVSKAAALDYSKKEHSETMQSRKVPRFHYVSSSRSRDEPEIE